MKQAPASRSPLAFASFSIYGETLQPEFWTAYFGVRPTTEGRKGERIIGPSGRPTKGIRPFGIWSLSTQGKFDGDELAPHLRFLKSCLALPRADLPEHAARAGVTMRFFCYWNNLEGTRTPVIPGDIRATADAMGIVLDIDEYR